MTLDQLFQQAAADAAKSNGKPGQLPPQVDCEITLDSGRMYRGEVGFVYKAGNVMRQSPAVGAGGLILVPATFSTTIPAAPNRKILAGSDALNITIYYFGSILPGATSQKRVDIVLQRFPENSELLGEFVPSELNPSPTPSGQCKGYFHSPLSGYTGAEAQFCILNYFGG